MKPIKLYYDSFPGKKLLHNEIKHTVTNFVEWQDERYSFHDILNVLGIPHEWTNDPAEGIVLIDIDSTPSNSLQRIIKLAGSKYKKFIIASLTEARYGYVSDKNLHNIWDEHPGMFLFDCGVPNPWSGIKHYSHPNYFSFPFMIPRTTSLACNGIMIFGENLNEGIPAKKWDFNHLSNLWRLEKFLTFYYMQKHQVSNCIQSYKPPTNLDDAIKIVEEEAKSRNVDCADIIHRMNTDPAFYRDTTNLPYHCHAYSVNVRMHPVGLYKDSTISIVSESYHGANESVFLVTEKCLQPMLNAHPCIIKGNLGSNQYMKSLGFEVYDEIFDYSFDLDPCMFSRAENVAKQMKNFNRQVVLDNMQTVMQKVSHNKNLLLNFHSTLYKNLREQMLDYIDRYYA